MSIRRFVPVLAVAALAAAGLTGFMHGSGEAVAQGARSFVIPANDGYGIADCLAEGGSSCGRIVADAWCQAHGMGKSTAFGPLDPAETTASLRGAAAAPARSYSVTCAG